MDESDAEALKTDNGRLPRLLTSYETKNEVKPLALKYMGDEFKVQYTEKNLKTTEKVDYSVIRVDKDTAECDVCPVYVTFSDKVIDHFADPAVNEQTGLVDTFINFTKNTEETAKRYLPMIAYFTSPTSIVYSSDFKTTDKEFQFVVNVIYVGVDESKVSSSASGEIPRAINLAKNYYTVDRETGEFTLRADISPMGQFKPLVTFPVTDDEVSDLI